uniref:GST N-terminal domain-containing protein n=1 Tax=Haptolina brevifila TaxID=156173 RepID=A0A7S2C477_9EUKA|mmetsp:Transcript_19888/g.40479  ORF Transcript_19888/g.40479 Transcript_19888/m.40479 type:complete len:463 (+) Transcript_19888:91-1479(+)
MPPTLLLLLLSPTASALRLLVAGGSGYLGRQVCRDALQRGWEVTSLSRRGANPLPGTLLDRVNWVKGSAADAPLLEKLAADADAFVHAIGLLLDSESGFAGLNFLTSGSRSVPGEGATYDSEMRMTALGLLDAAQATRPATAPPRPFVFVSAAEAGWSANELGSSIEAGLREREVFLPRYLDAKRAVEEVLAARAKEAGVRPIVARPSFMWDPSKVDILPLLPVWSIGHALNVGGGTFAAPLKVEVVGAAVASLVADDEAKGVVGSAQLAEIAPLGVIRRPTAVDTLTSGLASIARLPFGTTVATELEAGAADPRPNASALRLYEFEACPFCRRVREAATYLDLSYTVIPCGRESRHRAHVAKAAAALGMSRPTFPYLEDDTAGMTLFESDAIVEHLLSTYGPGLPLPPPSDYFLPSALATGWVYQEHDSNLTTHEDGLTICIWRFRLNWLIDCLITYDHSP